MVNRRHKKVIKNISDYIVPIALVLVILIIVLSFIFSSGKEKIDEDISSSGISIVSSSKDFEANVEYSGGRTSSISIGGNIHTGERLNVKRGYLDLELPNNSVILKLNRLGEIMYTNTNTITHYSSDLWVKARDNFNVDMRFARVETNGGVFSLSQNEVASTIYVVSGEVQVSNLAGNTGTLTKGKTVTVMRNSSNDSDFNLNNAISDIPESIIRDDWFELNSGEVYLSESSDSGNENTQTGTNVPRGNTYSFISFNNVNDEGEVLSDSMNIEGTILNERVSRIDINGITGDIDDNTSTFVFTNFQLPNRVNDLVYKVYDDDGNNLSKGVITLHNRGGTTSTSGQGGSGLAGVNNFIFGESPNYQILSPDSNPLETTESVVRIEGQVPVGTVEKITVNDFRLTQFPRRGTYWQYFANTQYGNLKEGLNLYNIKYFGTDEELLYENTFVIIKK